MVPLRIAFINPSGEIGGAERALLLLLEGLDRTRYQPQVICPSDGRLVAALAAMDVPTAVVPLGIAEKLSRFARGGGGLSALCAPLGIGQAAGALLRHMRAAPPDLIHTNGIKAHLIGGVCGRLLRRPVIWHMRDLVAEGRMRAAFRTAAGWLPQRIVTVSAAVTEQFAGCRAINRARTVHDAVDLARYRPTRPAAAVRAELGLSPETVVVAMVAHFTPWKGHFLFLETIARLVERRQPVAGLVIGGSIYRGPGHETYEDAVRQRSETLGLHEHVHFTGFQDCVPDYLNAADILIHPPTRPEPFGLAVIEAMALGKPVVAAAAGGVLETVVPRDTGLLVPPGDTASFAQATETLMQDRPRRLRMGKQGQQRVAQLFSPALHHARIERVYQEICPA